MRTDVHWVNRGLVNQPPGRPLSVVSPIADKRGRSWFVRYVPKADIARLAWNERGHQLRRPTFLWAVAGP